MHGTEHESETFVKYIVLLATPFNSPAFVHSPACQRQPPKDAIPLFSSRKIEPP